MPERTTPTIPSTLLDPVAVEKWGQMVEILEDMGVLTMADGEALGRYCLLYSTLKKANEFLASKKTLTYPIRNSQGDIIGSKAFPEVSILKECSTAMLQIEREFGLTPSARASLSVDPRPPVEAAPIEGKKDSSRFFLED